MALTSQSCSNDYLDVEPTQSISAEDLSLYNNNAGAEGFVTTIYAKFLDWNVSSFSWIGITSIASDEADKGSSPGDTGGDKNLLDALNFTPTGGSIEEIFKANYQIVNRCNQALYFIPQLNNADQALRDRLIGEAKFLRAFSYFTLVRTYGGVPIVDHVPIPGNEDDRVMQLTRKTKEEVYAFIEKDLKDAITALPDKSAYTGVNVGRASKGAAYALLAKVSLYQKKWQQVVDNCNLVTGYSLTPDFQEIYKVTGENNAESIFEIQGQGGIGKPGIQQYSQTQGARGTGGWGWGFNVPSQNLLNAFNDAGDNIRRDATIIFRGETLYDGRLVPNTVENPMYNEKAYSSANLGDADGDKNIRILRYGEILLIRAEAATHIGADAATPLNLVRTRVNLAPISSPTKEDVWQERRLELAFEHDRWFDIVRTGQGEAAMSANGKVFVVGKHELFPIPNNQIIQTPTIGQNPNW